MSITNLQLGSANNKSPGAVASSTLAYAANCTVGSLLICVLTCGTTGLTLSVSDSVNGAWTQAVAISNANATVGIFFFAGNASAVKPTVTCSQNGAGSMRFALEEWSGIVTSNALDQVASATHTSSLTASSGNTPPTTVANELVIGGITGASGTPVITAGGSATLDLNLTGRCGVEYQIVNATGAQSSLFNYGTSDVSAVVCATFIGLAVAPPAGGGITKWTPFQVACRLHCLQQGTLNVGNTQRNIANLLALAQAQIASPSSPAWAKLSGAVNEPKKILLWVPSVPGYVAPPGAPYAR